MKTQATVLSVSHDRAVVETARTSACEGCHKNTDGNSCSVCTLMGGDRRFTAVADNTIGASEGDTVVIESETRRVLWYAVLVFLLPLVAAALGWGIAALLSLSGGLQALFAAMGFLVSFLGLYVYSKLCASKRCDVVIVEIVEQK